MGNVNELSGDERLAFSVRAWKAAGSYYARIDAKENSDAGAKELQHLTGKGDTPLSALADLFIQADRLVSADA